MLDTHGRKYVQPIIEYIAKLFIKIGFTANQVTIIAFVLGLTAPLFVMLGNNIAAISFLWISGFLDAVDGTVARLQKESSSWGTLMDITFDRVVEVCIIISIGFIHKESLFALLILASSIIFSMTVFLTVGALVDKKSEKLFYYQAGLAERTEGFIFFTLMLIFIKIVPIIIYIFVCVIIFTGIQRLLEAKRILGGK